MDNRKKKKSKGKKPQEQKQDNRTHMIFDDIEVPKVVEPHPVCVICGEPIDGIAEAISEANGGYSHFDCVLQKIAQQENVQEPDKVSYIGHGNFAVISKDEEGKLYIKTRVPYESKENYDAMKKFVEGVKE